MPPLDKNTFLPLPSSTSASSSDAIGYSSTRNTLATDHDIDLAIQPATPPQPPSTDTMPTYDEEKNVHLATPDGKDIDRINPLQQLQSLPNDERRSSVSPDRATDYCGPSAPATSHVVRGLSQTRKYVLLSVFCMGVFIDGGSPSFAPLD